MPAAFVFPKKQPVITPLTEEHLWCLTNCHSYDKYWYFRTCYENELCPLCERSENIYPTLKGSKGQLYHNNHWTVAIDTFAEQEYRAQTLLVIFNEHVDIVESTSVRSAVDWAQIEHKIYLYLDSHFGDIYGIWANYSGKGKHTIDPVLGHCYKTFIIPDETGSVLIPAYKGPVRQREIQERAIGFSTRYESGEIPRRFQEAVP